MKLLKEAEKAAEAYEKERLEAEAEEKLAEEAEQEAEAAMGEDSWRMEAERLRKAAKDRRIVAAPRECARLKMQVQKLSVTQKKIGGSNAAGEAGSASYLETETRSSNTVSKALSEDSDRTVEFQFHAIPNGGTGVFPPEFCQCGGLGLLGGDTGRWEFSEQAITGDAGLDSAKTHEFGSELGYRFDELILDSIALNFI
jgi:hypothetical protein